MTLRAWTYTLGKSSFAEDVPGSDKLLKLEVDLGLEQRTVFAGMNSSCYTSLPIC